MFSFWCCVFGWITKKKLQTLTNFQKHTGWDKLKSCPGISCTIAILQNGCMNKKQFMCHCSLRRRICQYMCNSRNILWDILCFDWQVLGLYTCVPVCVCIPMRLSICLCSCVLWLRDRKNGGTSAYSKLWWNIGWSTAIFWTGFVRTIFRYVRTCNDIKITTIVVKTNWTSGEFGEI